MILHEEIFEFSSITSAQKGVFIVDMIGEEMNSKAIIKKGRIYLNCERGIGRECVLMDDND